MCNCTAGENTEKEERVSHSACGALKGDPRVHVFGVPDESPAGCGCMLSACSTISNFLSTISHIGGNPKISKTAMLIVKCEIYVFRLTLFTTRKNSLQMDIFHSVSLSHFLSCVAVES